MVEYVEPKYISFSELKRENIGTSCKVESHHHAGTLEKSGIFMPHNFRQNQNKFIFQRRHEHLKSSSPDLNASFTKTIKIVDLDLPYEKLHEYVPCLEMKTADFGVTTTNKIFEVIHQIFDPNNPYQLHEKTISDATFSPLEFCAKEEIKNSVRLSLLKMRNEKSSILKHSLTFIPSLECEVAGDYYKRLSQTDTSSRQMDVERSTSEHQRKEHAEALSESIKKLFIEKNLLCKKKLKLEDLVKEEKIPNIKSLGSLMSIIKPKRPLKPQRRSRDQARTLSCIDAENMNLIVHVIRGFRIPTRKKDFLPQHYSEDDYYDTREIVSPFIEISFQKQTARTHASSGPNPTWNHQFVLPIDVGTSDSFSSNLSSINDSIFIHLYDEVSHDLLAGAKKEKGRTIYQHMMKSWIGTLKIPFSAFSCQSKIEGTFPLDCPVDFLQYSTQDLDSSDFFNEIENGVQSSLETPHISLYLTIEPTLPQNQLFDVEYLDMNKENAKMLSISQQFPNRYFLTSVPNLRGEMVFLNRFIKRIKPPKQFIKKKNKNLALELVWFVSLLPLLSETKVQNRKLWTTSNEFINLNIGSGNEKSVLLTNFLLYFKIEAYLIIGRGAPQGMTSYTLFKQDSKWHIACAYSGLIYDLKYPLTSIQSIYVIVNEKNIYLNVQEFEDPFRINFNVNSQAEWWPFLEQTDGVHGCPTLQPEVLKYNGDFQINWKELTNRALITLRDAFMKWRPMHRTRWNHNLSRILQQLIQSYEEMKASNKKIPSHSKELNDLKKSFILNGLCIHEAFSTLESLVEALYSSGFHDNFAPNVEFAIALHIVPYPLNTASVWMYVASIFRKV